MKHFYIALLSLAFLIVPSHAAYYDLGVAGFILFADGIGRQSISLIDCLKDDLSIHFINTRGGRFNVVLDDVPEGVAQVVLKRDKNPECGVVILEDVLSNGNPNQPEYYYKIVPQNAKIKVAYSMFESTLIPQEWVSILNENFDMVVVPDQFLVDVYRNSGIIIPIFTVPLPVYLEDFFAHESRVADKKTFIFGNSGAFCDRKNQVMLLEAFAKTFGNKHDVCLKIHGRADSNVLPLLKNRIEQLGLTNVELIHKKFSWKEYVEYITSLDCYVSLSKGEGYSIVPREAMAAGIPCVLSDATAQKTLCDSGFVQSVHASRPEPAWYQHLGKVIGCDFACEIDEVCAAFKEVYFNYPKALQKAAYARDWVKQYTRSELKKLYRALVKPKLVILGTENLVTPDYLMTTSKTLQKKYEELLAGQI